MQPTEASRVLLECLNQRVEFLWRVGQFHDPSTCCGSFFDILQFKPPMLSLPRVPNKMIVVPRASVFGSGKEGEAGHPRMVDGA